MAIQHLMKLTLNFGFQSKFISLINFSNSLNVLSQNRLWKQKFIPEVGHKRLIQTKLTLNCKEQEIVQVFNNIR